MKHAFRSCSFTPKAWGLMKLLAHFSSMTFIRQTNMWSAWSQIFSGSNSCVHLRWSWDLLLYISPLKYCTSFLRRWNKGGCFPTILCYAEKLRLEKNDIIIYFASSSTSLALQYSAVFFPSSHCVFSSIVSFFFFSLCSLPILELHGEKVARQNRAESGEAGLGELGQAFFCYMLILIYTSPSCTKNGAPHVVKTHGSV